MTTNLRGLLERRARIVAIGCCLLLAILADTILADPLQPDHLRRRVTGSAFVHGQLQIATGNEAEARSYYRDIVAKQINFMSPETIENSSIKDLLTYFGYPNINARDLHRLNSEELMALSADGDILATAFFAPKIAAVETPAPVSPEAFGWRKLARFKAKPGSAADNSGMELLYFLQNIFEKSPNADPFDASKNVSLFNQAIATRKTKTGPYSVSKRALYFFAYDPLVKCDVKGVAGDCEVNLAPIVVAGEFIDDGALGFKLKASFEARNPETSAPGKDFFYVPRSCQDCHGRLASNGKVNFLDTDHWSDRARPNYGLADPKFSQEDFTALARAILYDGGDDTTTPQFKRAFDIIRLLNTEIRTQNQDAATDANINAASNFPLRAVVKWLELHDPTLTDSTRHVPPYERGFGPQPWDANNEKERMLIYYLNRYCYRCHSSVRYSVFERQAVLSRKDEIIERVIELKDAKLWMPQDRIFPGLEQIDGVAAPTGDLKEFLDLLEQLQ